MGRRKGRKWNSNEVIWPVTHWLTQSPQRPVLQTEFSRWSSLLWTDASSSQRYGLWLHFLPDVLHLWPWPTEVSRPVNRDDSGKSCLTRENQMDVLVLFLSLKLLSFPLVKFLYQTSVKKQCCNYWLKQVFKIVLIFLPFVKTDP